MKFRAPILIIVSAISLFILSGKIVLAHQNESTAGLKTLEIYASDKAAQVYYERDSSLIDADHGRLGVGLLITEERDNVVAGTFLIDSHPAFMPSLTLSIGARSYLGLLEEENEDLFALAGGIEASTSVLFEDIPLQLAGGVYLAPDIFTFGASDRVYDWRVSAGIKIRESVFAFTGVRFLQFDTRPGDREVDDQINVGVRWTLD